MTEQLTRIGRGVPGAQKPYRKLSSLVLAGAIMFAALIMLTVALLTNQPGSQEAAPTMASPVATTDVRGTCAVLVPVMTTGADLVLAVVAKPDGSTVDWIAVDRTIGDLQAVRPIAPAELRDDIQSQIDPLIELKQRREGVLPNSATLDLTDFRASGLRISAWCAQYAG